MRAAVLPLFRSLRHTTTANTSIAPFTSANYLATRAFCSAGKIIEIRLPQLADSIDSGTLASWEKKVGDYCAVDETIAIIDTDKVSVDIKAPDSGTLAETLAEEGDDLKVGDLIAKLTAGKQDAKAAAPKEDKSKKSDSESMSSPKPSEPKSAPKQVDEAQSKPKQTETKQESKSADASINVRGTKAVKMTPMRLKTAERLKEGQNTAASLTTFNEIDMSNLMNLRAKYKDAFFERHGAKLGFMSAFVTASVRALQELPVVNARIDQESKQIIYHDYVDISIAVSSPRGLVVPVLRNCEKLSFAGIEKGIAELGKKAKDNKLTLEEMTGGTFTVTNGGIFGSMMSTPMINMPQSAILGMHAIKDRAVVVNGKVEVRPMMYVAMTYDHRIIDGRESVTFLKSIKEKIEDPQKLILDL